MFIDYLCSESEKGGSSLKEDEDIVRLVTKVMRVRGM